MADEDVETLIVGAGPAGLALAACLSRRNVAYVIVDKGDSVGASWRNHYRRLHLHTVKQHSALPYMGFPDEHPRYPSRAQVVEYLERYAEAFDIVPRFGVAVERLRRNDGHWLAETPGGAMRCRRVAIATGYNREPFVPRFGGEDEYKGRLLHSADYRSAEAFAGQRVLVVGAGNTGAEIALDLCEHDCTVAICIRSPLHYVARDIAGFPAQVTSLMLRRLPLRIRDAIALAASRLTLGSLDRFGIARPRKGPISQIVEDRKIPLIDVGTVAQIKRGTIKVHPAIQTLTEGGARFTDGTEAPFDAIVLATGYRSGLQRWIEGAADFVDHLGYPTPESGRTSLRGLYTMGFANPPTGALRQIGLDAHHVADQIATDAAG